MERFLGGALDDVLRGAGEEDACASPLDRALGEHAGREVPHVDVLVFAPDGDVHHALPAQLAQVAVGQDLEDVRDGAAVPAVQGRAEELELAEARHA